MPIYTVIATFILSLFFTACTPTPDVPLSPELQHYALIKKNCESLRTMPGIHVPDALDKECHDFLRRLDKVNALDYKVAHFNDDVEDPYAKPKPEYILLQKDANQQHLIAKVEYEELSNTINRVSLDAVEQNELADVQLTLLFPETTFTKAHYDYYKRQAAEYHDVPQYVTYKKNYAEELVDLGLVHLSEGDKKSALNAFKAAAELNNAQAFYLVGIIYEAKHVDKAIEWYTKALQQGIKGARINLARLYNRNHEPKEAQRLYHEAAEDGDAYAQYLLYEQYIQTDNTKTNAMAREWVRRSAENGFPPAEYAYAKMLLKEEKKPEAQEWLTKAHEHGIRAANELLGDLYYSNKHYVEAAEYLGAAESAKAKYKLAGMYEQGLGVETNYYRAYILYKEAERLGEKKAKKDVARLAKLKTPKEEAHYDAAKRKERQLLQEQIERNGEDPILRNIRTKGMRVHLQGLVMLPLEKGHGFIIHSEDGKKFYVIDQQQQADVEQYQYVDITAEATGNPITVSNNIGLTRDIYQFRFQKHCSQ